MDDQESPGNLLHGVQTPLAGYSSPTPSLSRATLALIASSIILCIGSVTYIFVVHGYPFISPHTTTTSSTSVRNQTESPSQSLNYGLFRNETDYVRGHYYNSIGTVSSGKYAGYHIVEGDIGNIGNDATINDYLFVTKDFKQFIVDTSTSIIHYNNASSVYPDYFTSAVIRADTIGFQVPPSTIDEGGFVLVRKPDDANAHATAHNGMYLDISSQLQYGSPVTSTIPNTQMFKQTSLWSITIQVETAEGFVFSYDFLPKEGLASFDANPEGNHPFYKNSDFVSSNLTYRTYVLYNYFFDTSSTSLAELTPVVQTKQGTQLYEFKDSNSPIYQGAYEEKNGGDVDTLAPSPTYQQYIGKHPVLLFHDPWGAWEVLIEADSPFMGGKGKPVIYLYPPKTEQVSVQVDPVGGFTKTEPTYGNGWNVVATPQSLLTNTVDGKTYPYLFWEGGAKGVVRTPKEGFVVAQANIPSLLKDKLALLGLTAKESTDFMDFWVPRLTKAPYYFITFVPKSEMDRVAPLTVTPTPDTVIRILMDYQKLSTPLLVAPLHIHTPERTGFTVVEWGGILRD